MSIFEWITLILALLGGPVWIVLFVIHWLRLDNKTQMYLLDNATIPKPKLICWIICTVITIVYIVKGVL